MLTSLRCVVFFCFLCCLSQSRAQDHTTGSPILDSALNLLFSLNVYSNEAAAKLPGSIGVQFCEQWNTNKANCTSPYRDYTLAEGICRAGNQDRWVLNCVSLYRDYTVAEGICRAANKDTWALNCISLYRDYSLAEGICRAGNQNNWALNCVSLYRDYTVAEGICRAGLRDEWALACIKNGKALSVAEAIQLLPTLPQSNQDFEWDWDAFFRNENLVWVCRGVQTGQFAHHSHCHNKPQLDWRWPNK